MWWTFRETLWNVLWTIVARFRLAPENGGIADGAFSAIADPACNVRRIPLMGGDAYHD
jgi:hypothetical protein